MAVVPVNFGRQDARQTHRRLVLSEILLNGPVSRTEIVRRTGLGPASVSRISRELIDANLVLEGEELAENRPGRRFVSLDIRADGGYVLGVSMNVFQQYVSLADLKNQTIARRELDIHSFDDINHVVQSMVRAVEEMLISSGVDKSRVIGGAIAVAGAVDPTTGAICHAPLLGWDDVPIRELLSKWLGLPIHVEGLPNAVNLAETRFGLGRGHHDVIVFNASLGIGLSMLIDNRLIRGEKSAVGLIGDLSLWSGEAGERVTVDEIAGGRGVLTTLNEMDGFVSGDEAVSLSRRLLDVIAAAGDGDQRARDALTKAGCALGDVIDVVEGLMHPELIIVAGPLAWCPFYIRGARASRQKRGAKKARAQLETSDMSWRAASRWLALNEFLLNRSIDLESLSRRSAG